MPLIFKKAAREDLSKISVYVNDTSTTSPKYFRVSDVPQVLTKGKNLIRISAHPTNLVPGSQILVDVRDSNGNPIYFEIPNYLEQDKSRVISIWIYHDKGEDNTANGEATITLVGVSRIGNNGESVPTKFRGTPNVRWQTVVNVDRDRSNTSSVIFETTNIPGVAVSESIEVYKNQPQNGNRLNLIADSGTNATYYYKGTTPIVKLNDGTFNSEMLNYPIVLSVFKTPANPIAKLKNPLSSTFYSSSIDKILDENTAILKTPFTTSFADIVDTTHTYEYVDNANWNVEYFRSGSNVTTENQRSFANITLNGVDPIAGVVDKVKVLIKSDGLPGEYELLNEVSVPFSSSINIKVPVPSENLKDPKRLKIQYLNSIGEISRTETITEPFVFQGGNTYIGGGNNLISGSMFISDTIGSGIEMGGVSSGFIRSVGFNGQTSASLGKGPGGFVIYSGSGNLQLGEDVLTGVGMQMVGDNDDRHFIFTTANGGLLDVKTDKFFIGTNDTQFISGSDGNIEISSSLFHLDPQNNLLVIGADAVINADLTVNSLRTPAIINGAPSTKANSSSSIDSDGFARFVSASIGGFEVSETQINSANDNLILKESGQITGSNVNFVGGKVGGFQLSNSQISSTNSNIILKASGQITASDGFLFGNKNTSQYVQYDNGNLVVRGDLSVDQIFTPATINGVPSNVTNASSSITSQGFAKFTSASIGGWDITPSTIEGSNLLMRPDGILQTRDFASGVKGWKISSEGNGTAEFENVRIRGTMRTTTFEKESVNAVGGQLWIANSTTITGSVVAGDTTMSIKNVKGFEQGEILLIKKVDNTGFQTEYVLVNSSSIEGNQSNEDENYGRIYIERAYGSGTQGDFVGDLASSAQSYEDGQVIVSTGKVGTGYIKLNANPSDQATPYMDIIERTGSDIYDVTLAARIGDLSGLANSDYVFGNPNPGYGLATDNVFLQGGIRANTGSIGGINMDSGKLFTGVGEFNNSNTGFYVDSTSKLSLKDKLVWDGNTLTITGQINLSNGTPVEEAINAVTESSTARALSIGVDSQVFAFDNSTDTTATPNTIVFTISQQNLSGTITTGDVVIKKSDTTTITTPSLGGVVVGGSGQLSGSISFSGLGLSKSDLPLSIEVSKDSISDSTTIFKVEGGDAGTSGSDGLPGSDGTDAVTAFLTNESHTFPSDVSGTISSFVGGETDMIVFQGVNDVTTDYTFSRTSNTGVTSTIADNTVTITAMTHDSGSVIITATSASVSLSKTMSLAKSKQGNAGADGADGLDGADGTSAKTLVASVDSQVFAFDNQSDTSATPTEIIFSFNQQNLSGVIGAGDITITTAQGGSVTGYSLDTNSVSGGSGIVSGSVTFSGVLTSGGLNSTKANLPITISVSKDSLSDSIKVFKVEGGEAGVDGSDGTSPIVSLLSNESHTLVAATDGTVTTYGGSGTEVYVYEGTSELNYDGVGSSNGTFNVSASGSSITAGSISDGGTYAIVGNQSSMTQDSATITYTISGKASDGTSFSQTKLQSFSKSKQGSTGAAGTDAKVVSLTADSLAITYNASSVETPSNQSITLTADEQNHIGTVYYDFLKDGVSQQNSTTTTFTIDTSGEKPTANGKLTYTVKTREGSSGGTIIAQDSISIYGIKEGDNGTAGVDGTSAITAFLTNDSQTFPAASDGTVSSFSGGSTDMIIYQGIDDVTSNYSITRLNSTGVTSTISSNTITVTAMAHDSGSITITAASASVSIDKVFSLSKSKQGTDGADGADNQDFSWANENLVGVGPAAAGLLMTANVFGFHDGISGANGSLDDFTSYLDSSGNFYLGSGSSDAQFVWDNISKELLVSGSNARIEVDKFFVGTKQSQYISGSNGNIEISSSNFHLSPNGDVTMQGTITANAGTIGGFEILSTQINSSNDELILKSNGQITGSNVLFEGGRIGGYTIDASNLNAYRLAEEFTTIANTSGTILYGDNLPTDEIDSRAEILIGSVKYGISTIGSAQKATPITLDSNLYTTNKDFTIFYSGSEFFEAGRAKFESVSYASEIVSESIYALTSSIVSLDSLHSTPYYPQDENSFKILSTVTGVDSLVFEISTPEIQGWKSGSFGGYYFTTQEEERFRFWPNNENLQLYLSSDIAWFDLLNTNGDISDDDLTIISDSLFLYSPQIAERGGIRPEEWYQKFYNLIIENGLEPFGGELKILDISQPIPVLGASSLPIEKFNPEVFSNQAISSLNYNPGYWFSVYLEPGYFINPQVIEILSNINSTFEGNNLSSPNTWWEIENTDGGVVGPVGAPFKLMHSYVELVQIPSTNLRLSRAVWPTDIAENGTIPIAGAPLNTLIGETGRTASINITSRISSTEVATDLTIAQLESLYGGVSYPNYSNIPYQPYQAEYEAVKSFISKDNAIGSGVNALLPKVSIGELSGSFVDKVTFQISGSGVISSSKFYVDELGNISGSNVNFVGGSISGSNLTLIADTFQFGKPSTGATIQGGGGTMIISSSLFSLTEDALSMKGSFRGSSAYMQDTYMGGKVVSTGVINPNTQGVRYQLPFIEVYSTSSADVRFTSTAHTSSVFQGSHGSWVLSSVLAKTPQMITKTPTDGVPYPDEFKAWYDISGVDNDYKYISDFQVLDIDLATSKLPLSNINTQLILNKPLTPNSASKAFATMTSEFINISASLSDHGTNAHLQFAIRGTTHPYSGSFVGFYPEYLVQIVSGSNIFYSKQYKDENACNHDWTIIDVPISDVLRKPANASVETTIENEFKVQIGMRYSGSSASGTITGASTGLGWALTEMRMVEPVRAASIDTQTIHFKDTYFTWGNKLTTEHKGNLVPVIQSQSNAVSSSFSLGSSERRWKDAYLGLSQNNIVSSSTVDNKLVRIDINSGRLSYTSASIGNGGGGGGGSYTHPTHPGDDINIDTGVLTGATVISDLDFNITTDTLGHVTDANGTIATRTLTLANLGYTGATNANNYSLPEATATTRGGIELFSNTDQLVAANVVTSTSGRTYGIQLNTAGQAVVNVPWTDGGGGTTYYAGTGLTLNGTTFSLTNTYDNYARWNASDGNSSTNITSNQTLSFIGGGATTVTLDTEINTFTITSTDTNTDTNTTYSAGSGLDLTGTTFSVEPDLRDGITHIGIDTTDYISFTNNTQIDFFVNGGNEMRLQSNGDLHVDGDVIAYSTTISDKRLKDNVFTIDSALDKVNKLRGVEYIWNAGSRKGQSDIGFIAQEVEEVIPQIVREKEMALLDGNTYKTVDYEKMTAVLIEAVKEQQTIINKLEQRIVTLESGSKN